MSRQIRNWLQTSTEREIIKTCPDMVVYIEGLPFIINPYLSQEQSDIVSVNFNDYVTAITVSYSIDSFEPTGSVVLSIPNGYKHLFMAPGGNTVFEVLSAIRIYAKGYYFSKAGNSVYRRIFNGVIKAVDMTETLTSLELSIQIVGICRLIEIMQTEMHKSLLSNSSTALTVFKTNQGNGMSVYEAIYDMFDRALDFSEFITSSLSQDSVLKSNTEKGKAVFEALKQEYIVKWGLRLQDLRRDVRLFGAKETKELTDPLTEFERMVKNQKQEDPGKKDTPPPVKIKESDRVLTKENAFLLDKLRAYHFDMSIGSINLTGSQLVPRIERIRQLVELAGFEGYQDTDGLIIIKPPLYNLDCTVLGDNFATDANGHVQSSYEATLSDENLYEDANPYIVQMSEILSESYSEDESAIRRTSMTLSPNFGDPNSLQIEGHVELTPVVRYVDINLLRQFGIREEPPKYFGFLTPDAMANYGFCICELNKANRNYRTYHLSIPLRPELRLGFPIFLPHKDMYGYITGISMSYNVGSQATTSVTCNYIRKRPLYKQKQTVKNQDGTSSNITVYASQPNLIHAWVKGGKGTATEFDATGPQLKENGLPATVPNTIPSDKPSKENIQITNYFRKKMGNLFETWSESLDACWRVQKDGDFPLTQSGGDTETSEFWFNGQMNEKTGVREHPVTAELNYMRRLSVCQPYTDEKGYEVVPALPWGRYTTLRAALVDCTRNYWYKGSADTKASMQGDLKKTSAFIMSGLALPATEASVKLQAQLDAAEEGLAAANANAASAQAQMVTQAALSPGYIPSTDELAKVAGATQAAADAKKSVDALNQAKQTSASDSTNSAMQMFEKFDKSNVISFELAYSTDSGASNYGKTETDFANQAAGSTPAAQAQANTDASSKNWVTAAADATARMAAFLMDTLNDAGAGKDGGRYAVDLRPQNTDLGLYQQESGPFSGVISSMGLTINNSPYGKGR